MGSILAALATVMAGVGAAVASWLLYWDNPPGVRHMHEPAQIYDNRVEYPTGDTTLAQAAGKARATLPRFFELAKSDLQGSFLLKMSLGDGSGTEHIWMSVTGYSEAERIFMGTLANDPVTPGREMGDEVVLREADIEDWMVNTGAVRYGGYTIRAMLKNLPEKQAAELREQFRD